jgi:crcB protein
MQLDRFLLICLGGAAGSGTRYLATVWAAVTFGPSFPAGTLLVNVLGSFLIGLIMEMTRTTAMIGPDFRLFLTTGFLGGFTTYSAFNEESLALMRQGAGRMAAINIGVTLASCLIAGAAGMMRPRRLRALRRENRLTPAAARECPAPAR